MGRDGAAYGFDLGEKRRSLFLQLGLDRPNQIDLFEQITFYKISFEPLPKGSALRAASATSCRERAPRVSRALATRDPPISHSNRVRPNRPLRAVGTRRERRRARR